jgi:hypothetical protein
MLQWFARDEDSCKPCENCEVLLKSKLFATNKNKFHIFLFSKIGPISDKV